jgi:hypothetical protein
LKDINKPLNIEECLSPCSDKNVENLDLKKPKSVTFEIPQHKSILHSEKLQDDNENFEAILPSFPLISKVEQESKKEQISALTLDPNYQLSAIKQPNDLKQKNQEKSILISELSLTDKITKPLIFEPNEDATQNKPMQNLNSPLDPLPIQKNESTISKESNQKQDKISQIKPPPPPPPIIASQSRNSLVSNESFFNELQEKIKSRKSFETESFQIAEKSQADKFSEDTFQCILKKSIDNFKFDYESEIDESYDERMKEFEEHVQKVDRKGSNGPVIRSRLSK